LTALLIAAGLVAQRISDGPTGPISGGRLQSGELVSDPDIDWSFAVGQEIELQLVEPMGSRTTGVMVHEGELYVACDLGFIWARFSGRRRWILNVIYLFKGWHEDVMRDGRVVLRIEGKLYERQAVRVTDPELLGRLRRQVEVGVAEWIAPEPLAAAPSDVPNDIWFFRMDPRPGNGLASARNLGRAAAGIASSVVDLPLGF
jgi:hypothetical protein